MTTRRDILSGLAVSAVAVPSVASAAVPPIGATRHRQDDQSLMEGLKAIQRSLHAAMQDLAAASAHGAGETRLTHLDAMGRHYGTMQLHTDALTRRVYDHRARAAAEAAQG